ncbi:MAG: DUF1697 domain-containing protein [Actinobacteria bacterium]|nr:MAG: DUF1697 domain-containing protein [Actinomycetota bacterium]
MARLIVLLRGVNLGSTNRVPMPKLRAALEEAGFEDVATYVQSGNVVLSSGDSAPQVARTCERVIKQEFGLEVPVVVRTRAQLARIVKRNPLGKAATNPKRYQVSFLEKKPTAALVRKLEKVAAPAEQVVAAGREIYAWHPEGVARSKLWAALAGKRLGVTATARNWTTVTKLLELADA